MANAIQEIRPAVHVRKEFSIGFGDCAFLMTSLVAVMAPLILIALSMARIPLERKTLVIAELLGTTISIFVLPLVTSLYLGRKKAGCGLWLFSWVALLVLLFSNIPIFSQWECFVDQRWLEMFMKDWNNCDMIGRPLWNACYSLSIGWAAVTTVIMLMPSDGFKSRVIKCIRIIAIGIATLFCANEYWVHQYGQFFLPISCFYCLGMVVHFLLGVLLCVLFWQKVTARVDYTNVENSWFAFSGRLKRRPFFRMLIVESLLIGILTASAIGFKDSCGVQGYIPSVLCAIFTWPLVVRRFHDRGISGKWLLLFDLWVFMALFFAVMISLGFVTEQNTLLFSVVCGLWLGIGTLVKIPEIILILLKGNDGPNKYGE